MNISQNRKRDLRVVLTLLGVLAACTPPHPEIDNASRNVALEAPPDSLEQERVAGIGGRRLDSLLSTYESQGFSGAVLVVHHKQILLAKGYGYANKELRIRNSPATRYELSSLTKMFTAGAILQLAGQGRLRLDDPIEKHLGVFPADKRAATIEQLASHTAGLTVAGAPVDGRSRDAFVSSMKSTPMESPPGTRYRYTNAGYSLLAAIVEVKSGIGYEDYLRRYIFAPAGMRYTYFRDAVPVDDTLFAHGYGPPDSTGPAALNPYSWGSIGAGGVWSTLGDVFRWVTAVDRKIVIPGEYHRLIHSAPRAPSREAFGWHVYPRTDSTRYRIEKGGGANIFATQLLQFPDDGLVIIWASNDLTTKRWRQTLNQTLPPLVLAAKGD